jgi:hypothetical protein
MSCFHEGRGNYNTDLLLVALFLFYVG